MRKRTVLVTGASSGLGLATVSELAKHDFHVLAATRTPTSAFEELKNIEQINIDVADDNSIHRAFDELQSHPDFSLWGLVNNAGICIPGPLEMLSIDGLREQIATNVIGQFAIVRAALPAIRASRGRIVNVTSGLGSIAVPYLGAYSIAQFAKMALTDALRRELTHAGVSVSVIQPGAIYTPIWDKFVRDGMQVLEGAPQATRSIYERSFREFLGASEQGARASTTTPHDFAQVVLDVLTTETPQATYFVGEDARRFGEQAKALGSGQIDEWFLSQVPTSEDFASRDEARADEGRT